MNIAKKMALFHRKIPSIEKMEQEVIDLERSRKARRQEMLEENYLQLFQNLNTVQKTS